MTTAAETGAETQETALSGGPEDVRTQGAEPAAQAAVADAAAGAAEPALDANGDGAWGVGRLSFDDAEKHASRFKASWEVDDHVAAPGLAPAAPSFSADGGLWAAAGSATASPAAPVALTEMPAAAIASPAAPAPAVTTPTMRQRAIDADATGQLMALPMSKPSRNPLVWAMGAVVLLLIAGGLSVVFSGSDEAPVAAATPAAPALNGSGAAPAALSVPDNVAPGQAVLPSMATPTTGIVAPVVAPPAVAVVAPVVTPPAVAVVAPPVVVPVVAVPVIAPPPVVAPRVVAVSAVAPRPTPIAAIPTPPAPETVRVQIRVTPPNATVTFDGMRVRTPYDVRLTKNRTAHRVDATLDGYQTLTQSVELSRDREITLTMRADAPAVVAAPRGRPRPRPQAQPQPRPTKRGAGFVTDNPFD